MEKNLLKTFVPLIVGLVAGVLSYFVTGDLRTRDPVGIIVLVFFIYLHKLILPKYGVEIESKDWVGIGFLTLATWYISWTILLNM
ncbi:hypothetical protein [Geoglobus acetivorans]|uniref:Permease n=1 Tax=Geoglobus acetivorans TaxID=565033 RepID=A0ABZ3H591_GEOAI|nr:hypothetical protein [Geoglobus acetivorans]